MRNNYIYHKHSTLTMHTATISFLLLMITLPAISTKESFGHGGKHKGGYWGDFKGSYKGGYRVSRYNNYGGMYRGHSKGNRIGYRPFIKDKYFSNSNTTSSNDYQSSNANTTPQPSIASSPVGKSETKIVVVPIAIGSSLSEKDKECSSSNASVHFSSPLSTSPTVVNNYYDGKYQKETNSSTHSQTGNIQDIVLEQTENDKVGTTRYS